MVFCVGGGLDRWVTDSTGLRRLDGTMEDTQVCAQRGVSALFIV